MVHKAGLLPGVAILKGRPNFLKKVNISTQEEEKKDAQGGCKQGKKCFSTKVNISHAKPNFTLDIAKNYTSLISF